jgi:hypothetical protein
MIGVAGTRREVVKLRLALGTLARPPADPLEHPAAKALWFNPGDDPGIAVIDPAAVVEAVKRAYRRSRGRGGISAAIVSMFLYGDHDSNTGPLILEDGRRPGDWDAAYRLCGIRGGSFLAILGDDCRQIKAEDGTVYIRRYEEPWQLIGEVGR